MDGSLANFQLGISPDGTNCMMIFVDEEQRMTTCSVSFQEFSQFIASLSQAAGEMARRRTDSADDDPASALALNVSSAAFKLCARDGYVLGALASDAGEVVGIRMCPDVANQMTRAMLLTLPAMSTS
ncbi:MAG: hypothetical protein Q8N31_23335 [Reyranella sp.]|nr:hypothetical protein [Reyranella sp.]MDP3162957.1 hypothetical protein [Reyranella sp.]